MHDEEEPARHLLRVIAKPEDRERLAALFSPRPLRWDCGSIRAERRVQAAHIVEVETPHGTVRIKVSGNGSFAPEYEDCKVLAHANGAPLNRLSPTRILLI